MTRSDIRSSDPGRWRVTREPRKSGVRRCADDADTGEVIAEDGSTIGVATNNVAEYSGLIAGLRLAAEFAPDADIEVRMDSKLVVEQMSGNGRSNILI